MTSKPDQRPAHVASGRFTKSVAVLIGGGVIGQAIAFAASPVLSRLYAPTDFGVFAAVSSATALIAAIASLRYEWAIPLPREGHDAGALLSLSVVLVALTSALTLAAFPFAGESIAAWLELEDHRYLLFVPATAAAAGLLQVASSWCVRERQFRSMSMSRMAQALASAGIAIAVGAVAPGPVGLILGLVVSPLVASLAVVRTLPAERRPAPRLRLDDLRRVARRYRSFPLLSGPTAVLNAAGQQAPLILILSGYGAQTAGAFAFCYRVLAMPLSVLGRSVANVYWGEAAALTRVDPAGLRRMFFSVSGTVALLLSPLVAIAWFLPDIFVFAFGDEWLLAGQMSEYLAYSLVITIVASSVAQLSTFEANGIQLCWDIGRLVAVAGVIAYHIHGHAPILDAVKAYAVTISVAYAGLYAVSYAVLVRFVRRQRGRSDGA